MNTGLIGLLEVQILGTGVVPRWSARANLMELAEDQNRIDAFGYAIQIRLL